MSEGDATANFDLIKGTGNTSIFNQGKVVTQLLNTEYADKAALYKTMFNKATTAGWWQNIKDGMKTQAGRLAENSLLLKKQLS